MAKVRELFRDNESTEFVIVTIPTVICLALRKLLLVVHEVSLHMCFT